MFIKSVAALTILGALLAPSAFATSSAAPHTLNFSGYLTDSSGNPLNDTQDLIFSLDIGGTPVWCAEYSSVSASQGQVSVVLGSSSQGGVALNPASCVSGNVGGSLSISSSLLSSVSSSTPVTLSVSVNDSGTWETLSPSFPISSALFALQAENAQNVGGVPASQIAQMNSTGYIISQNGTSVIDPTGNWVGASNMSNVGSISLSGGSGEITGVSTPSSGTDAVNKTYDDGHLDGISITGTPSSGQVLTYNGSSWTATSAGTVTSVSASPSSVLSVATATSTPAITIQQAGSSSSGYLSSSDWSNFNSAYTTTSSSYSANLVLASPNGSSGAPSFRALASGDIPNLSSSYLPVSGGTMSGSITMGSNILYGSSSASANLTLDSTSSGTKGYVNLAPSGGNVGIGTTTPSAQLDVAGQIRSAAYNAGGSTTINWNNGNNQYTAPSGNACTAITLNNALDGGSYTLAVQGVTSGTCTFSATGLTFVYSPVNVTVTTDAVYTFLRMGTKVYVSWVTGFQ